MDDVKGGTAPDPYDHANPYFVRAIRECGRKVDVLDVGCWNGALGRALMRAADVVVDGIEKDASQADRAMQAGYRSVLVIDLNREVLPAADRRYDFILFGDVLEHLVDPEHLVRSLLSALKPGGRVLCSVPNVAFLQNRLKLLFGRWNYGEYGILDRTHLRFYTRKTIVDSLSACGLRVQAVYGYVGLHGYPFVIREPLRWLGKVWPTAFAVQIVTDAVAPGAGVGK